MDHKELIALVREHPLLYDVRHKDYRNIPIKTETWKEIALTLGVTAEQCSKRWTSFRERYSAEKRMMSSSGKTTSNWYLMEDMGFIEKHFNPRRIPYKTHNIPDPKIETLRPASPTPPLQLIMEFESVSLPSPPPPRSASPSLARSPCHSTPTACISPAPLPPATSSDRTNRRKRRLANDDQLAQDNVWGRMVAFVEKSLQQYQQVQQDQIELKKRIYQLKLQQLQEQQEKHATDGCVVAIAGLFAELKPDYRAVAITRIVGVLHSMLQQQARGLPPDNI